MDPQQFAYLVCHATTDQNGEVWLDQCDWYTTSP